MSFHTDPRAFTRLARAMDHIMSPMSQSMSQMRSLQDQLLRFDPFFGHVTRNTSRRVPSRSQTVTNSPQSNSHQAPARSESQQQMQREECAQDEAGNCRSVSNNSSGNGNGNGNGNQMTKGSSRPSLNPYDRLLSNMLNDFWSPLPLFATSRSPAASPASSSLANFPDLDFRPTLNVTESKDNYALNFNLPGVKKDEVKITIDGDQEKVLTVSGERRHELKEEKDEHGYLRVEEGYGRFSRSIALPEHVNTTDLKARFEDGVLKLTLPKIQPVEPPAPKSQHVPIE